MATLLPMNYSSGPAPLTPSKHLPLRFSFHLSSKKTRRWLDANAIKLPRYHSLQPQPRSKSITGSISATMATGSGKEVLPPVLTSNSKPPPVFDGTTRLYISYTCPYAQRVWIARNCKGLQEKIKLVPIDLQDRPAWYKEKVYPTNKVPSLEHNNEVKGESIDLIKYIDSHFDGPSLFPDDPAKKEFAEELFSYTGSFSKANNSTLKGEADEAGAAFDCIETALSKFDDGPFFLGQFSLVDIAYAPFIERFQPTLLEFKKNDITAGRPKLTAWIEEMNKIEAYNQTRHEPKQHVETYKKRFLAHL
ncbi:protein IN2 [Salix suchowensis]|nr:protein IN2 [Salix suchowensis]